jgi:hypothetical protein
VTAQHLDDGAGQQGVGVGSRAHRSPVLAVPMQWKEAAGSVRVQGGNGQNARARGREQVRQYGGRWGDPTGMGLE